MTTIEKPAIAGTEEQYTLEYDTGNPFSKQAAKMVQHSVWMGKKEGSVGPS